MLTITEGVLSMVTVFDTYIWVYLRCHISCSFGDIQYSYLKRVMFSLSLSGVKTQNGGAGGRMFKGNFICTRYIPCTILLIATNLYMDQASSVACEPFSNPECIYHGELFFSGVGVPAGTQNGLPNKGAGRWPDNPTLSQW